MYLLCWWQKKKKKQWQERAFRKYVHLNRLGKKYYGAFNFKRSSHFFTVFLTDSLTGHIKHSGRPRKHSRQRAERDGLVWGKGQIKSVEKRKESDAERSSFPLNKAPSGPRCTGVPLFFQRFPTRYLWDMISSYSNSDKSLSPDAPNCLWEEEMWRKPALADLLPSVSFTRESLFSWCCDGNALWSGFVTQHELAQELPVLDSLVYDAWHKSLQCKVKKKIIIK